MKILKMHATFGKLREQTLTLDLGMNILCGANESGKSTWSAFLRVMLYGISTREKSKIGFLADKEKYAPWSGDPMYGKIEFLWQGKHCVMERRAGKNGVLQKAKITDLDTGKELAIPEPVGETLLGVRREVFERSAFIAQAQLALTGDKTGELERRITALSTTGEEDFSQKQILERLEKWKRKLQYYKKGEIPDLIAREQETSASLDAARQDAAQLTACHTAMEELKAKEEAAQRDIAYARAFAARGELSYMDRAERDHKQCAEALHKLESARTLTQEQCRQIAEKQKQFEEIDKKYTECVEKVRREQRKIETTPLPSTGATRQIVVASLCALAVFAALFFVQWVVAVIAAVLTFGVSYVLLTRAFCRKYGAKNRRELDQKINEYHRQIQVVRLCEEECEEVGAQREHAGETLRSVLHMLNAQYTIEDANALLQDAAALEAEITETRQKLAQMSARAEAAQIGRDRIALQKIAEQIPEDALYPERDVQELQEYAEACRIERERRSNQCAALQERITSRGELGALENTVYQLREQIVEKKRDLEAVELAIETMSDIQAEMQRKFAPVLEKTAGELFEKFTGGHFHVVQIEDAEFSLAVSEHDAAPPRNVLELSQGTLDELYLAVRLALCEKVLSEDVPIILDDAMVNFDDKRMENALSCLQELANSRQILLFTCHQREKTFGRQQGIQTISIG